MVTGVREHTKEKEQGQPKNKMKPVIAWETITGLRGGEGRNYSRS
jgi:hypothetical protein